MPIITTHATVFWISCSKWSLGATHVHYCSSSNMRWPKHDINVLKVPGPHMNTNTWRICMKAILATAVLCFFSRNYSSRIFTSYVTVLKRKCNLFQDKRENISRFGGPKKKPTPVIVLLWLSLNLFLPIQFSTHSRHCDKTLTTSSGQWGVDMYNWVTWKEGTNWQNKKG